MYAIHWNKQSLWSRGLQRSCQLLRVPEVSYQNTESRRGLNTLLTMLSHVGLQPSRTQGPWTGRCFDPTPDSRPWLALHPTAHLRRALTTASCHEEIQLLAGLSRKRNERASNFELSARVSGFHLPWFCGFCLSLRWPEKLSWPQSREAPSNLRASPPRAHSVFAPGRTSLAMTKLPRLGSRCLSSPLSKSDLGSFIQSFRGFRKENRLVTFYFVLGYSRLTML